MGDVDHDLNTLIKRFVDKLKVLLEWCDFNKLDINWSKTYFMFITNKRVKLPTEITIVNNKSVDIKVGVVTSFKLLGITIDNKLTFLEHCSIIKKTINRKLFSIKRLFFLCTSVKIHFFKTFILPYFDYCLSLIIYFPPAAYQSLSNCFNLCLDKLFKFKPDFTNEDEDEEKVMRDFVNKLQSYDLFTLQSRIYNKLLMFANNIIANNSAPIELKVMIGSPIPTEDIAIESVEPTIATYNFRKGNKAKAVIPKTKFETLTFRHFFPRLLRIFQYFDFALRKESFKIQITTHLKEGLATFLKEFSKFNIKYSAFYRKKKNKNPGKVRRNTKK